MEMEKEEKEELKNLLKSGKQQIVKFSHTKKIEIANVTS